MPEIGPKHQPVLCRRDADGVAVVTIDRPERRNALNLEVKSRIAEVVSELVADDTVRVIVLTGSGDYFVAGTDIAEMATMTPAQHVTPGTDHVFNVMRRCPKPLRRAGGLRPRWWLRARADMRHDHRWPKHQVGST